MGKTLTILNFDGGYQNQDFYCQNQVKWIDFRDLSGVRGYCEETAAEEKAGRKKPGAAEESGTRPGRAAALAGEKGDSA